MNSPRSHADLLREAASRLVLVSDSPRLDAELLLARALERKRSHLLAWPERVPSAEEHAIFENLLNRRAAGEPIAHILGEREFWSMELSVTPDTLIPRPETEILVEAALEHIPADRPCRVLDMGTGTGAIALAIARERPFAEITATDRSAAALVIARRNAERHKADIRFLEGDWWSALDGETFDIAVSNPPYIREQDPHLSKGDVRFEPASALVAGADGLADIRKIILGAAKQLVPGGQLLLEHGYDQADETAALLAANGFTGIRCLRDLSGKDRVSIGQRPHGARHSE